MIRLRICLVLCLLVSPGYLRSQDISLDKLSDCQGLTTLQNILKAARISANCRMAHNPIESAVTSQLVSSPGVHTCLLSSPPISRLSGFSCVEIEAPLQREIICFRTVSGELLDNYIRAYDTRYKMKVNEYLTSARKCSVGNGDATAAPNSLLPSLLNPIGRARFGFALQVGNERDSMVYHGYADLNPDVDSDKLGAIEVFDFIKLSQSTVIPPAECGSKKGITLSIDSAPDASKTVENLFRQQYGERAVAKIRFITLTYCSSDNISSLTKKSDLDEWQDRLKYILAVTDYREIQSEDFRGTRIKSLDDMRDLVGRNMPFGQRDTNRPIGPHLLVMIDDSHPQCLALAEAMVFEPEEDVKSDYGTVGIVLIGLGNCSIAQRPNGTLSDQLLEKLVEYLRRSAVK